MNLYCVSLKTSKDRRRQMEAQFAALHLPFQFVDAIDKREAGITGEIACLRSHLLALQKVVEDGAPLAIICEDDACFRKDFRPFESEFPMVLLCPYVSSYEGVKKIRDEFHSMTTNVWGTCAYQVTLEYAKKALQACWEWHPGDTSELITTFCHRVTDSPCAFTWPPMVIEACGPSLVEESDARQKRHRAYFSQFPAHDYWSAKAAEIPKIIHHVWPGEDDFRERFHAFRQSWFAHHPDWTFMFWRLHQPGTRERVKSDRVAKILEDPRYTVTVKADLLRLYALYTYGGIYADTDMECLKPFDALLSTSTGFFTSYEDDFFLGSSLLGAAPEHPFVAAQLKEALRRIESLPVEVCNEKPNEITSPHLITELAKGRDDVTVFPREHFYPVSYVDRAFMDRPTPHSYAKHYWNGAGPEGWTHTRNFGESVTQPKKFDLGGVGRREGYKTVNLHGDCDVTADIIDLDAFCKDGTVDEFLLVHTLEHVPAEKYKSFLERMRTKLKPGGCVRVIQTDAEKVIHQYVRGNLSFRSMRSTLFTPPDRLEGNELLYHRNMWSADELAKDFESVGFRTDRFDGGSWSMDTTDPFCPSETQKDHGKWIANLGVLAIK